MNIRFAILLLTQIAYWIILYRALHYGRWAVNRMLEMEKSREAMVSDLQQFSVSLAALVSDLRSASEAAMQQQANNAVVLGKKVDESMADGAKQRKMMTDTILKQNAEIAKVVARQGVDAAKIVATSLAEIKDQIIENTQITASIAAAGHPVDPEKDRSS